MERRRWPWKRKSSEKASRESDSAKAFLSKMGLSKGEEEHTKPVSFIQISLKKYEHLNLLEEQVEVLNHKLNDMKEKLSSAQADMTTKDDLVKMHAKVAEEAISGWEKAEAETLGLKHELESVTQLKLTVEEQASHLDTMVKDCMKQICIGKEESEKKLHDVVFSKTKLWEKVKSELEATIADFEQELLNSSAELAVLSRSLQERSVLLMKISDEKHQADAENEVLKSNIQSYERETSSLKYELNIAVRGLEIRNEEKNMSVNSAEIAQKQQIEGMKKITKLEAECHRLRSLVRKRLPGPAALAQMKLEVGGMDQSFGESKVRRLSGKISSPYTFYSSEINVHEVEHCHKENELLTARLIAMEEESKMLKKALSKRNCELQALSNRYAKTAKKLRILEADVSLKLNTDNSFRGSSSRNESTHSLASMSEYGIDEEGSCAESWASALISELSQLKKERDSDRGQKTQNSNQSELLDDFLEMERLASLTSETNEVVSVSYDGSNEIKVENCDDCSSADVRLCVSNEQSPSLKQHSNIDLVDETQPSGELLSMILARISSAFESKLLDSKMGKLVIEIMKILQDAQNERLLHSSHLPNVDARFGLGISRYNTFLLRNDNSYMEIKNSTNQELRNAISWIHDFVILLYKEGALGESSELQFIREKVEEFSNSVNKLICINLNLSYFVHFLSHVLSETKELRLRKWIVDENCCNDCIDKVTLLENGVSQHDSMEEKNPKDLDLLPSPVSGFEDVKGPSNPSSESDAAPRSFSLNEYENLKTERDDMEVNLINCRETLESTNLQLAEIDLKLAELKRLLSASQKSNDLADTQLRCMTESYKLLELRAEDLQAEINMLRSKTEVLENELITERHSHQDDLAKYNSLQKQIRCSSFSESDVVSKARQDKEIAAATDKLAACQETIILLNKQLNSLHPPLEPNKGSHYRDAHSLHSYRSQQSCYPTIEKRDVVSSSVNQANFAQDEYSLTQKPTASTKHPKHRPRSTSASSLSSMLNDKHGYGCSRFFSKGKNEL